MPASINHAVRKPALAAFTLIELLIVIVILGVIAGVTLPNFRNTFDDLSLHAFVKQLYYLENYLRESAITKGTVHCLIINSDRGPLEFSASSQAATGAWEKVKGRFGRVYKMPQGIVLVSIEPVGKNNIYFYPDGSADFVKIIFENNHKKQILLTLEGVSGAIQMQ